jgi:hypothetical protein
MGCLDKKEVTSGGELRVWYFSPIVEHTTAISPAYEGKIVIDEAVKDGRELLKMEINFGGFFSVAMDQRGRNYLLKADGEGGCHLEGGIERKRVGSHRGY